MSTFKPTFEVGALVKCVYSHGYGALTEGRTYTVTEVEEPVRHNYFTFPEYVSVIGDHGKTITAYPHRFRPA
jgi:hypothetical protein